MRQFEGALPGGAEITLTAEEREHVAQQVATTLGDEASAHQVAHATAAALQQAHATKLVAGGTLDDNAIEQATAAGLKTVVAAARPQH